MVLRIERMPRRASSPDSTEVHSNEGGEINENDSDRFSFTFNLGSVAVSAFGLMLGIVPLFSAFEAHVVNVTARIEPPPAMCDAGSKGFFANNEGCNQGTGSSDWYLEVQDVSLGYEDYFGDITGAQICSYLWIPNCGSEDEVLALSQGGDHDLHDPHPPKDKDKKPKPNKKFCDARAQILALELNLASRRLNPLALLAGADDGSGAFIRLGLDGESTIGEALAILEMILSDPDATTQELMDAARVADQIIKFYEKLNPYKPQCIYDPYEVPYCKSYARDMELSIDIDNSVSIVNSVHSSSSTGGNSANGGDGSSNEEDEGESSGGVVVTGNATSTATSTNQINITEIEMSGGCCTMVNVNTATTSEPDTAEPDEPEEETSEAEVLQEDIAKEDDPEPTLVEESQIENEEIAQEEEQPAPEEEIIAPEPEAEVPPESDPPSEPSGE